MSDEMLESEWSIDHDDSYVHLSFTHLGPDGVETFDTSMPFDCARDLADALVACANCGEGHG